VSGAHGPKRETSAGALVYGGGSLTPLATWWTLRTPEARPEAAAGPVCGSLRAVREWREW
jgi:hypothetical protein